MNSRAGCEPGAPAAPIRCEATEALVRDLFPGPVAVAAVRLTGEVLEMFPQEAAQVAGAVRKRQVEFSAGRWCARQALAQLGHPPCAIVSASDRSPVWPAGVVGSLSHDDHICLAVVSRPRVFASIGVDVEAVGEAGEELGRHILRPDERADALGGGPREGGVDGLTLHFCLKEAAYKAFYPLHRQVIGFQDMRIRLGPEPGRFRAEAAVPAAPVFDGGYAVRDGRICAASWCRPQAGLSPHRTTAAGLR